jgi:hypothetical protein
MEGRNAPLSVTIFETGLLQKELTVNMEFEMKDFVFEAFIIAIALIIAAGEIHINVNVNVTDKPIVTQVDTAEHVIDYNLEK